MNALLREVGKVGSALVLALGLGLLSSVSQAHESRPFFIEITGMEGNGYKVQWRVPESLAPNNIPTLTLPSQCESLTPPASFSYVGQALYRCEVPIAGQELSIRYPGYNPSVSTLIKYRNANGEQHTQLLAPDERRWQVPDAETRAGVAWDYTVLGVEHIWAGVDHLLFVLCLLWIAGSLKRILVTITGFTVAHSLTLALSALEWVRLPVPPVEAAIALSIVFLASEIVKGPRQNLTWRYPIAVSSSFGLLHGFGFAAALSEVGLPQTELLTGLLFFNVGVEIGQVVFAAAVIGLVGLLTRVMGSPLGQTGNHWARQTVSYGIGGIAAFWLVERCVGFVV